MTRIPESRALRMDKGAAEGGHEEPGREAATAPPVVPVREWRLRSFV